MHAELMLWISILVLAWSLAGADSLSIVDYGAGPNDDTDDNGAIEAALSAARDQGKEVYVPAGTFIHRKFRIEGVTVYGSGDGSVLHAPNSKDAQITLWGYGSQIRDLKSTVDTQNRDPEWCDNIRAEQADSFVIRNITIDGCDGAGIMVYIASNGLVLDNRVSNSLSDGIHNAGGSYNIIVAGNRVRHTGDDHIAVVSYGDGPAELCHNILIQDNDVADQTWGRGMSVVGGYDITFRENVIARSSAAGFLVATEGSYTTGHAENILIEDNTIVDPVYLRPESGHSGILVSADNQPISEVLFRNNTVTNSPGQGVRIEGSAVPENIGFENTGIENTGGNAFVISSGTNIYCTGTTLDGEPISPCDGELNFTVTGSSLTYDGGTTGVAHDRRSHAGAPGSPAAPRAIVLPGGGTRISGDGPQYTTRGRLVPSRSGVCSGVLVESTTHR